VIDQAIAELVPLVGSRRPAERSGGPVAAATVGIVRVRRNRSRSGWRHRSRGPGSTCTRSSTSTAAMFRAGCWPGPSGPSWPSACWPARSPSSRSPLQDPQAPARVPRPVRLLRGRPRLLHPVPLLGQPGPPPLRGGSTSQGRTRPGQRIPDQPVPQRQTASGSEAMSCSIRSAAWRSLGLLEVGVGGQGHVPVGVPGPARRPSGPTGRLPAWPGCGRSTPRRRPA
jgi:hypothetical protein